MEDSKQESKQNPVNHLLRGMLPDAAVATIEAEATPSSDGREAIGDPMQEALAPSPSATRPPGCPMCVTVACKDVAKTIEGSVCFFGIVNDLFVEELPALFTFNIPIVLMSGQGRFVISADILNEDGSTNFSLQPSEVTLDPATKAYLYYQLVRWQINRTGEYRVVVRANGYPIGVFPFRVIQRSVK